MTALVEDAPKQRRSVPDAISRRSSRRIEETRRYYERHAERYARDTGDASLGVPVAPFVARLPAGASVVDLGSGSGRDLAAFGAAGIDAFGIDTSPALAALARRRSGSPVVVADMTLIPCPDGVFDGAWASASLLHLGPEAMDVAFAEVRRVLRPGGLLFTSMKRGLGERREPCGRWFSYVEPAQWHSRLEAAGFSILESDIQSEHRPGAPDDVVSWLTCTARRT